MGKLFVVGGLFIVAAAVVWEAMHSAPPPQGSARPSGNRSAAVNDAIPATGAATVWDPTFNSGAVVSAVIDQNANDVLDSVGNVVQFDYSTAGPVYT